MFSCPPRLLCHILLQNQNEQHSTLMNAYMRLTTMYRAYTYVIFYFSFTGWKNLMNSTDLVFHTVNEKSKHAVQNFYLKRWVKNIFGAKIQIENQKNNCTKNKIYLFKNKSVVAQKFKLLRILFWFFFFSIFFFFQIFTNLLI